MSAYKLLKKISNDLSSFLTPLKQEYSKIGFDFSVIDPMNEYDDLYIEFTGYYFDNFTPKEKTPFKMLVVLCNDEEKQLHIPNIFLPKPMHHHGFGLKMVDIIRKAANEYGYQLFIIGMVNSFYNRMLNRGALPCNECDDAVCITEHTDLNTHY